MLKFSELVQEIRDQKAFWKARQAELDAISAHQNSLRIEAIARSRDLIRRVDSYLADEIGNDQKIAEIPSGRE